MDLILRFISTKWENWLMKRGFFLYFTAKLELKSFLQDRAYRPSFLVR